MSDALLTETLLFPRLDQATTTPSWMRPSQAEVRAVNFGAASEPAACEAPGPVPEPEPAPAPEPDLEALFAELAADREALAADRASFVAERQVAEAEERGAMERFVAAAAALGAPDGEVPETLEEPLMELAVGIAEVLVEQALETDPELHKTLACAALAAIERTGETSLLASRESYAAIVEVAGGPCLRSADGSEIKVELDPGLSGLGVVAKVGPARVDARLRERLTRVREALIHERRLQRGEMA